LRNSRHKIEHGHNPLAKTIHFAFELHLRISLRTSKQSSKCANMVATTVSNSCEDRLRNARHKVQHVARGEGGGGVYGKYHMNPNRLWLKIGLQRAARLPILTSVFLALHEWAQLVDARQAWPALAFSKRHTSRCNVISNEKLPAKILTLIVRRLASYRRVLG
jgi:hypothetical protein